MPRIRKKTSNRQSTNDRKKISQKARESRKKASKKAKKAPEQWKSKTKKDPGIPNNYPYKDEILKEMQESRRQAAEEKERQKEQNRARKASAKNVASEDVDMDSEDEDDSERKLTAEEIADGIADITARAFPSSKARSKQPAVVVVEEEEEEDEVPVLLNRDLPDLEKTIDAADAVVYVLDARDPLPFRSADLEEVLKSKKKKVMFVLNKIDLCPKESVSAWLSALQSSHPTFPFRSSSAQLPSAHETPSQPRKKSSALFPKDDSWASAAIISQLDQWASNAPKGAPLSVAVVGVTNVGKSSLINSLAHKSSLPVYSIASCSRGATTTTLPQEVTLDAPSGRTIRLIDTPGLAFQNSQAAAEEDQEEANDDDKEARDERRALDILHRNRGRIDKLKDPKAAASQIIARASYEDLMLFYNLPAFVKGNVDSFLTGLARSQRLVKKRGEPDLAGACRIVLRDWNTGRFPWYAMPEASSSSPDKKKSKQASSAESAEEVLEKLQSRKEKMMSGGIVKMAPGAVETRKVELTAGWVEDEEEDEDEDDDEDVVVGEEDVDGDDDDEMDDDEEDEEEEEEEEEDSPPPPPPTKGKRKASSTLQPTKSSKKAAIASESSSIPKPSKTSSKKVAFAAPASPSTTKESSKPPKKQLAASKTKLPSATKTSKKGPIKAKA